MDHPRGLHAALLQNEGPDNPMHVGSLAVLDGAPFHDPSGRFRLDAVRAHVEAHLDGRPRFRQRLVDTPLHAGPPSWIDDPDFDVTHHVKLTLLPAPGTFEQLLALSESLQEETLDRTRALWELWFVDGLPGGQVAVVEKVHHALADGVDGVGALAAFCDPEPVDEPTEPDIWQPRPAPSRLGLVASTIGETLASCLGAVRAGAETLGHPARVLRGAFGGITELIAIVRPPWAPPSTLNRRVGPHRRLLVVRVDRDRIERAAEALGAAPTDVLLAGVAGGLRELLVERSDLPPGGMLQALVVDGHRPGPGTGSADNDDNRRPHFDAHIVPLPVAVVDHRIRLDRITEAMRALEGTHDTEAIRALLHEPTHLPGALAEALERVVSRQPPYNVVVSTSAGPSSARYLMGARLVEWIPILPLGQQVTVGIAAHEYGDQLILGVHVDPVACPDAGILRDGIDRTLGELLAEVPATPPRRSRRRAVAPG